MFSVGQIIRYLRYGDERVYYGIYIREFRSVNSIGLFIPGADREIVVHCSNVLGTLSETAADALIAEQTNV